MSNAEDLEKELVGLKLKKRELILAGKNTDTIDEKIRQIEQTIKSKYLEENNDL
ncbi:hypothetical protein [Clostridium sp. 'White wine YQ']|uniref:hypothetical protein n=1 Tax=Clostridium sp. 'White wine YQ' TaxID=3027474 RepID=UPI0023672497|nr:hypothetical protein [Clostridium sp. 'White wine YQ']MDD7796431.1 hypothetical protein [Clostridium sp. 'White wine YQ']